MSNKMLVELSTNEFKEIIATSLNNVIQRNETILGREKEDIPLNAKQAADYLNISLPTLHKWKKEGSIPFHRKGGRIYFMRNELLISLSNPKTDSNV